MIERLTQILITEGQVDESRFSPDLARNIASLKALYSGAENKLWTDAEIREFLEQNFPDEVLEAYLSLSAYAFQADLARYCILHKFGGLYSDLSYLHLRPIEPAQDTDRSCSVILRAIRFGQRATV